MSDLTRASRDALLWISRTESVPDPAGNTIYDEMRTNFLPRIEAAARAPLEAQNKALWRVGHEVVQAILNGGRFDVTAAQAVFSDFSPSSTDARPPEPEK